VKLGHEPGAALKELLIGRVVEACMGSQLKGWGLVDVVPLVNGEGGLGRP
jgi:hypothetical protein